MENLEKTCEKAITIISLTHDGNDLSPSHLHLTECAVNGMLNDHGWQAFDSLYDTVLNGQYSQPWLQGIEHITVDHEGYIYYKGHCVEHYDYPYDPSNKDDLEGLAERCRHLEQLGIKLNTMNAVWYWDRWAELTPSHSWLSFFKHKPYFYLHRHEPRRLLIVLREEPVFEFEQNGAVKHFPDMLAYLVSQGQPLDPDTSYYDSLKSAGFIPLLNKHRVAFVKLNRMLKLFARFGVPNNLFESY